MSQLPPSSDQPSESLKPPNQDFLRTWLWRFMALVILVILGFLTYELGSSFLPRWWAQFIGDLVQGSFLAGTALGIFFGFTFTFLPISMALLIRHRVFNIPAKITIFVLAILLAAPNWVTLFIALSNEPAAVAGWQTFNVNAPTFMWSSAVGAVIGAVMAFWIFGLRLVAKRRKKKISEYKSQTEQPKDDLSQ